VQVKDIVKDIVNGDLRQTSLANIGTSTNKTDEEQRNLDAVVSLINQGVLELHKRFPIKVIVEEEILRTPTAFDDPIVMPDSMLELISITTMDSTAVPNADKVSGGYAVPVDNYDIEHRYFTGNYNGVYVKTSAVNSYLILGRFPASGVKVAFRYKAAPDALRYGSTLPLPAMYVEALMNYVAYRGYSTVPSVTPAGDTGLTFKKKFEDSCLRIEQNTDTLYEWANPKRLLQRGFV
jgi:hypothetical protein